MMMGDIVAAANCGRLPLRVGTSYLKVAVVFLSNKVNLTYFISVAYHLMTQGGFG